MAYSRIGFHPGPRVASIVLSHPPLNVIDIAMMDELHAALDEADDLGVQVLVFSGSGDRGFSAGVDVADHRAERAELMLKKFHGLIRRIRETDSIVLAAIHGHTLGGGAELALACDLIIAAEDTRIGFPEIDAGCFPPFAASMLAQAVGHQKASDMILLGRRIGAGDAERLGLVNAVVPAARLIETADGYVDSVLSRSSAVLAVAKRAIRAGRERSPKDAFLESERLYRAELLQLDDMTEGIRAFLEKRPASWSNR